MLQYRVTKYDPKFRDGSGAYTRDEWTSFCDIDSVFAGMELTPTEYLRVENAYLSTAQAFLSEAAVDSLIVKSLECSCEFTKSENELANGMHCDLSECAVVARMVLRNKIWCRLVSESAFLHFGYDYYMYIGVSKECPCAIDLATESGLFVEPFDSPYLELGNPDE